MAKKKPGEWRRGATVAIDSRMVEDEAKLTAGQSTYKLMLDGLSERLVAGTTRLRYVRYIVDEKVQQ